MKQPLFILCTLASTLCVAGCMVGPRYQRPVANAPQVFRGATLRISTHRNLLRLSPFKD
jgi:hypothetical protein